MMLREHLHIPILLFKYTQQFFLESVTMFLKLKKHFAMSMTLDIRSWAPTLTGIHISQIIKINWIIQWPWICCANDFENETKPDRESEQSP